MSWTLHHGDCREVLAQLPDASVDAVVTDPPYELGFMGKAWDAAGVAYDLATWAEVLRVLKPGGHLLAFGGTRTYHRMTCAIEDAGFEVRDSLHWLYGSGFPKSLDVSKAIDKQRHDLAEIYELTAWVRQARDAAGIGNRQIDEAFGFSGMAGHWTSAASQPAMPTLEQVPTLLAVLGVDPDDVPERIRHLLYELNGRKGQPGPNWAKREVLGERRHINGGGTSYEIRQGPRVEIVRNITAPATDDAARWEGWGTALKPAHEPVVIARKPLAGTVAQNVQAHGTGALNVNGCRVGTEDGGRWPSNLVLTHSAACGDECAEDCPVAELDRQSGVSKAAADTGKRGKRPGGFGDVGADNDDPVPCGPSYGDQGGASRFFTVTEWDAPFLYIAKPDKAERAAGLDGNHHPTVKPLDLMRWLVRLVTPPGATVLDPFAGSGTTLAAAVLEDRNAIGVELTADYLPLIEGRCRWAEREARFGPVQGPTKVRKDSGAPTLFDEDGAA